MSALGEAQEATETSPTVASAAVNAANVSDPFQIVDVLHAESVSVNEEFVDILFGTAM